MCYSVLLYIISFFGVPFAIILCVLLDYIYLYLQTDQLCSTLLSEQIM